MTTARERLLGWFAEGILLRPDPRQPNLVDLSRALALLGGVEADALPGDDPNGALALRDEIGPADHVVFVLADGLGVSTLEHLPADSFLRANQVRVLRSVFPSATASAVTSLATGEWPNRHGVSGWWTYLDEHDITATALPFVERFENQPLGERGITTAIYPRAALLTSYRRDARTFQPAHISDSEYTDYLTGTTPSSGYFSVPEGVDSVLERVRSAPHPTYTYLYIPTVDQCSHHYGPDSPEVAAHLAELQADLERLASGVRAAGGRFVLSADHGQITIPPERRNVLRGSDELIRLLRFPPTGEPRAPLFHVRPGAHERFARAFDERFGERFLLLPMQDVEALELFGPGPISAVSTPRVGDFLAVAPDHDVLLYRPNDEPAGIEKVVGHHGGLAPNEVRIPLIVY